MADSPPPSSSEDTLSDPIFAAARAARGSFLDRYRANQAIHRRHDELLGGAFNPFKDKPPPLMFPKVQDDSEISDSSVEVVKKKTKEASSGEDEEEEPSEKTPGRNSLIPAQPVAQEEDAKNRRNTNGVLQNFMQRVSLAAGSEEERFRNLFKTPEVPKNPCPVGRKMFSERQRRMEAGLPVTESLSECSSTATNSTMGRRGMDCSTPKTRSRPLSVLEDLDVSAVSRDRVGNDTFTVNSEHRTENNDTLENENTVNSIDPEGNETFNVHSDTVDSEEGPVVRAVPEMPPPAVAIPVFPHYARPTAASLRRARYQPPPKAPQVSRKTTSSGPGSEIPEMDESDDDNKNRSVAGRINESIISIGMGTAVDVTVNLSNDSTESDMVLPDSPVNHDSDVEDDAPPITNPVFSDDDEEEDSVESDEAEEVQPKQKKAPGRAPRRAIPPDLSSDEETEEVQLKQKKAPRRAPRRLMPQVVSSDEADSFEWDGDDAILLNPVFRSAAELGLRRSKRARMAPVRPWLGERAVYTRSANGDLSLEGTNRVVVKVESVIKKGTTSHAKATRNKK